MTGRGDASPASRRTTVRRLPERGAYDRDTVNAILDEGLIAHVGIVTGGQPAVIPMAYARDGDHLLLHGARSSRLVRALAAGEPACVTVTLLDGLVLARSAFHHSMNYRSVVAFGRARTLVGRDARERAFRRLVEHLVPGRWPDVRPPDAGERRATEMLSFPLDEASAKIRTGPPGDDPGDLEARTWAGVVPLVLTPGEPEAAPDLPGGIDEPPYVRRRRSRHAGDR